MYDKCMYMFKYDLCDMKLFTVNRLLLYNERRLAHYSAVRVVRYGVCGAHYIIPGAYYSVCTICTIVR